jgi:hypothetical protein
MEVQTGALLKRIDSRDTRATNRELGKGMRKLPAGNYVLGQVDTIAVHSRDWQQVT